MKSVQTVVAKLLSSHLPNLSGSRAATRNNRTLVSDCIGRVPAYDPRLTQYSTVSTQESKCRREEDAL